MIHRAVSLTVVALSTVLAGTISQAAPGDPASNQSDTPGVEKWTELFDDFNAAASLRHFVAGQKTSPAESPEFAMDAFDLSGASPSDNGATALDGSRGDWSDPLSFPDVVAKPVPPASPLTFSGDLGRLSIGQHWQPFYLAVGGVVDPAHPRLHEESASEHLAPSVASSSLRYSTPSMKGLVGQVSLGAQTDANGDYRDIFELAALYGNGPLFLGAGYRSAPASSDHRWGLSGGYAFGNLQLSAAYQRSEGLDLFGGDDALRPYAGDLGLSNTVLLDGGEGHSIDLVAQYSFGKSNARLGFVNVKGAANVGGSPLDLELDTWIVGFEHQFGKNSQIFAEYQMREREMANKVFDDASIGLGVRHEF